jgi:23S rRNA G2445 N2-methylase RlmL
MNYEAEVVDGLKPIAESELWQVLGRRGRVLHGGSATGIRFEYEGNIERLFGLRTVVAVYECRHFPIPRPKAFLGSQNLIEVLRQIKTVRKLHPKGTFKTIKIAAAGDKSDVFQRLAEEIAQNTKMQIVPKRPDMLVRIRPAENGDGWEVLTRLTPLPLSARPWRVANMAGALNANVAAAMVDLTYPKSDDHFLNLMCGSGTLLAERVAVGLADTLVGTDIDAEHLALAAQNLEDALLDISLLHNDDSQLPFPDHSFNKIVADFPWGQLVQSQQGIYALYADTFKEIDRIAAPEATFVLTTHNVSSFLHVLAGYKNWYISQQITLNRGKTKPTIYALQRNPL